ncbi:MAG: hypothetical protein CMA84_05935 [Euryarchaeota archaeon]|nr:hypothetical protein [Euryarchaeota archaeon]
MSETLLGYPVCSGWFEEFCIYATDWLNQDASIQSEQFNFEPMCNFHQEGVFLSKKYWVAMVKMFGYSLEEGTVLNDYDYVQPIKTTIPLNTRSYNGDWLDTDIMEAIAKSKGIVIG